MDKILKVTGFFDTDGRFCADPWFSYPGPRPPVAGKLNGEYSVYVYGSEGKKVAVTHFDAVNRARAYTANGPVPMEGARIPVDVSVRLPEGAARVAVAKGGAEIYSRDVPRTAPEVAFTGMAEGQGLDGKVALTWEASGAAGHELHFEIWYYPREDVVFKLATDVTGRFREIDLSDCPGTDEGHFCIIVTDGVNTADSRSPGIRIPFRPPVITTIQKEIPQVKTTERLFFKANVYDKQDGWMGRPPASGTEPQGSIVWRLNGEEYDRGDTLSIEPGRLPPGVHTFTCTAANSHGLSTDKEFSFEVISGENENYENHITKSTY
ncbi:MAG: hypothetical protein FWG03_05720 [Clostridiales bacterium]|nr:hypothetical protein [Clostridiales bacterium]